MYTFDDKYRVDIDAHLSELMRPYSFQNNETTRRFLGDDSFWNAGVTTEEILDSVIDSTYTIL